ncbi:fdxN element excision controlling factor protein [Calothrix parasitica NIES-267]|uniref:FdxN element excision controlling factor protein n=1 Tax=Calothrix parasitica NIES-267 TaxID=1973488 RepID=A0A1Z4LK40_9CYAN|nr:fdxN element excision controlling factor protein [Calothrix parasitica NIES-267]
MYSIQLKTAIDEKIWIQYNIREEYVAQTLVEKGVPNLDIVIGFRSAFKRQFTSYAVN